MKKRPLLMLFAGLLFAGAGFVSCDKPVTTPPDNTLEVAPSEAISFQASENEAVVLTIKTDAKSWDFKKPDWVTASKDGDKLTVNVQENTTEGTRAGRIEFSAGTAKTVAVSISQAKPLPTEPGEEPDPKEPANKIGGSLQDDSKEKQVRFLMEDAEVQAKAYFSIAEKTDKNVDVEVYFDAGYLQEYNYLNGTSYQLFPESLVTIADGGKTSVPAGSKTSGDVGVTIGFDASLVDYNDYYLVPLFVKAVSDNVAISNDECRVNYIVKRKVDKEVKNVLYFEVNDVNPLNALEYYLDEGQMFFDAVVLFAANINYNQEEDVVILHNNPNVKALLDESDVYLQPLREKGIKVYLGILGNHDAAGICQLSDWGAKEYAKTLANAVDVYKLDGVSFDDEYSRSPDLTNKWFTRPSKEAGSRLCYETKKAMREVCGEDKDVMVFYYGSLYYPIASVDGIEPGEFVDLVVSDYGGYAPPSPGMSLKNCSGMSVELGLNRGSATENMAQEVKKRGFGWFMWFHLNPDPTHGDNNLDRSIPKLDAVCKGLYGQGLRKPTGYYKKVTEGQFDPQRYELK